MAQIVTDIGPVKAVGNFQSGFMFNIYVTPPVILGFETANVLGFTYMAVSTNMPQKTTEKTVHRWNDQEFTTPGGSTTEHEWTFELKMTEIHAEYDMLVAWWKAKKLLPINTIKSDNIYVALIALDGKTITKVDRLIGAYVINTPEIADLSHDSTEGSMNITATFAYDDIEYNVALPSL
jgi:hypothetical protein